MLVARIVAGTLRFNIQTDEGKLALAFKKPTPEQVYVGQEKYREYYEDLKDSRCMSEDEVVGFLLEEGLWSEQEEETLKSVTKDIESFKIKLYNSLSNPTKRK